MANNVLDQLKEVESQLASQIEALNDQLSATEKQRDGLQTVINMFQSNGNANGVAASVTEILTSAVASVAEPAPAPAPAKKPGKKRGRKPSAKTAAKAKAQSIGLETQRHYLVSHSRKINSGYRQSSMEKIGDVWLACSSRKNSQSLLDLSPRTSRKAAKSASA